MAATAIAHLRPNRYKLLQNPAFVNLFSSSSTPDNPNPDGPTDAASSPSPPSQSPTQSSFSSFFNDVKASLKQSPPFQQREQPRKPFSLSSRTAETPPKIASLEEIRKNLSEFRRRSTGVLRPEASQSPTISFQELYKRNVFANNDQGSNNDAVRPSGQLSFETVRNSLKQLRTPVPEGPINKFSLEDFKQSLKIRPPNLSTVIGDKQQLPSFLDKDRKPVDSDAMKMEFVKSYSHAELGEKLRKLRPEVKGKNWFSFTELNERLMKLREIDEKETESKIGGTLFKDVRESLVALKMNEFDNYSKKSAIHRLGILGQLGGTPSFMLSPPKEHLVEKYFHPDLMSSSEKLKLKLKEVRDEFKMSESDCGSARVQVAQLTTKIKHLSAVLHKKDKHSRKGLIAMVQQRKKLLKYLRRTDWDSYCLVLGKLGLRDNPGYKN